jgi:hypothetical protein
MWPRDRRRIVRLLRDLGLYAPFRLARAGFAATDRRRWTELRRFRRREGAILRGVASDGSGPKVFFAASSAPGLFRVRIEAMMAKALEARGCRPVWLVDRYDVWPEEHLRSFGFRDFVYFNDFVPERSETEVHADELLRGCNDLFDVLNLTDGGAQVGFHAASRALNRLRRGRLDIDDPEVHEELRVTLTNSLVAASAAERTLDYVRPDKFVATAQNLTPWAEYYEAALRRGIDTLYWMPAPTQESFLWRRYSFDDRHEHFFTLAPDTWAWVSQLQWTRDDADQFIDELRESYLTGNWFHRKKTLKNKRVKNREEIVADLGLDPAKKTAFIFSHVLYDATFWFGENLFEDYVEWLVETVRAAVANPRLNWVVKLHPENVRRLKEAVGVYDLENLEEYQILKDLYPDGLPDHVKLMTPENDTSTLSLFEFADYALTVRGTIGLEFPCFGVPTLTAGTGGYSGRGFTVDSATREEYLSRLARLEELPRLSAEEIALAQRFSFGVFHLKPVPFTSFEALLLPDEQWEPGWNAHSFEFRPRSAAELRDAPDLDRFAEWALSSRSCDLLASQADSLQAAVDSRRVALAG